MAKAAKPGGTTSPLVRVDEGAFLFGAQIIHLFSSTQIGYLRYMVHGRQLC